MPDDALRLAFGVRRGSFSLAVDAALPRHGITGLTGPSGAGKSSLLRAIAGLDRIETGHITAGHDTWADATRRQHTPAYRRPVGYVFQDSQLFPHLTVEGNLAYAIARQRDKNLGGGAVSEHKGPAREDVIAALDLAPLLERQPMTLSGGEQRRVALARALLTAPRLLLLDEPMTGLERARKRQLLPYIARIHSAFGLPMLYVSHDAEDLAQLADTLWIMEAGRLRQTGPAGPLLSSWLGSDDPLAGARLDAMIDRHDPARGLTHLTVGPLTLEAPYDPSLRPGDRRRLWIRASDVALAANTGNAPPAGLSIRNVLPAHVAAITPVPGHTDIDITLTLDTPDRPTLKARLSKASTQDLALAPGRPVYALLKAVRLEG